MFTATLFWFFFFFLGYETIKSIIATHFWSVSRQKISSLSLLLGCRMCCNAVKPFNTFCLVNLVADNVVPFCELDFHTKILLLALLATFFFFLKWKRNKHQIILGSPISSFFFFFRPNAGKYLSLEWIFYCSQPVAIFLAGNTGWFSLPRSQKDDCIKYTKEFVWRI